MTKTSSHMIDFIKRINGEIHSKKPDKNCKILIDLIDKYVRANVHIPDIIGLAFTVIYTPEEVVIVCLVSFEELRNFNFFLDKNILQEINNKTKISDLIFKRRPEHEDNFQVLLVSLGNKILNDL